MLSILRNQLHSVTRTSALRLCSTQASSEKILTVDRLSGDDTGIVLLRMNKPNTRNAISKEMLRLFYESVNDLQFDIRNTRVIIVKSDVPNAFCTGADLKERATMKVEEVPRFVNAAHMMETTTTNLNAMRIVPGSITRPFSNLMVQLERMPQPVIAAIDGYALGGGLEMALACDMRTAAHDALMGLTETRLAIIPGAGGTQRLTRIVGPAKAKELIYTARMINGKEAAAIGLVNDSVDSDANGEPAYTRALDIAREILRNGPIGVMMAKRAIDAGAQCDINTALRIEEACYAQVIPTKDRLEALAAFKEKRKPNFRGE